MDFEMEAKGLVARIREAEDPSDKYQLTMDLGDLRFVQYKTTKDPREHERAKRLARNCYFAAKHFVYEN